MSAVQDFFKLILSESSFEAIRDGTKLWLLECSCGHKRDLWDAGGVRYKAGGKPRQYGKCPQCGRNTWHKVRKKTDVEVQQV
jgi:hypothetical protein